jgi:hypothetical protein
VLAGTARRRGWPLASADRAFRSSTTEDHRHTRKRRDAEASFDSLLRGCNASSGFMCHGSSPPRIPADREPTRGPTWDADGDSPRWSSPT